MRDILANKYLPNAIRGVKIPKSNEERKSSQGECLGDIQLSEPRSGRACWLLGIPTVVDRWLQQAVSRTRMGGWTVAQSLILKTTLKVAPIKRKGYIPMVDYYSKFNISIW